MGSETVQKLIFRVQLQCCIETRSRVRLFGAPTSIVRIVDWFQRLERGHISKSDGLVLNYGRTHMQEEEEEKG